MTDLKTAAGNDGQPSHALSNSLELAKKSRGIVADCSRKRRETRGATYWVSSAGGMDAVVVPDSLESFFRLRRWWGERARDKDGGKLRGWERVHFAALSSFDSRASRTPYTTAYTLRVSTASLLKLHLSITFPQDDNLPYRSDIIRHPFTAITGIMMEEFLSPLVSRHFRYSRASFNLS